jgi:hypothetical protein
MQERFDSVSQPETDLSSMGFARALWPVRGDWTRANTNTRNACQMTYWCAVEGYFRTVLSDDWAAMPSGFARSRQALV